MQKATFPRGVHPPENKEGTAAKTLVALPPSEHAGISGKVLSVEDYTHCSGDPVLAVTIANDGKDQMTTETGGALDPFSLSPEEIRQKVREAGIVGLGGAAFPTAVKLSPPKDKHIDILIINGCEREAAPTAHYRTE